MKLTWKVSPVETGLARIVIPRGWPTASYSTGKHAAAIYCSEPYDPKLIASGNHPALTVYVMDHSGEKPINRKINRQFATLAKAKEATSRVLDKHPHFAGKT